MLALTARDHASDARDEAMGGGLAPNE